MDTPLNPVNLNYSGWDYSIFNMCLNKKVKIYFTTAIGQNKRFLDSGLYHDLIGVVEKVQGKFMLVKQDGKRIIFNIDLISSLELLD